MNFLEKADFNWMEMLNFYEPPFRAKLNPSKVWKDLDRYKNDSRGLINYCKKWRCRVEFRAEPTKAKYWKDYVGIGGEYDPESRQSILHLYTLDFDNFKFSDKTWTKFKYRLIQTLMHEIIHFMQFHRRDDQWSNYVLPHKTIGNAKKDNERRYLSEFDEIQAYAHCVYLDLKNKYPHTEVSKFLSVSKLKERCPSSTLKYILKTFNYDCRNNKAIHKLFQQILKWDRKYKINSQ